MNTLDRFETQFESVEQKFSWEEFVKAVSEKTFKYPALKVAYLAQCILESGYGRSELFKKAGNPTGLKWRQEMEGFATKFHLVTPTEPEGAIWCSWDKPEGAIDGYWRFIGRDRYQGWEDFGDDPKGYIQHLVRRGYATDPIYIDKVTELFSKAKTLLGDAIHSDSNFDSELKVANWFKIELSSDKKPILYAMAGDDDVSSFRSTSKQELCDFLLNHSQAQSVRLSSQIKVIEEEELRRIQTGVNAHASWFQFWRTEDNRTALLGMIGGYPANALISSDKAKIVKFLKDHPNARTIGVANSGSVLDWTEPPRSSHTDSDHGSRDAVLRPSIEWVSGCRNFSSRSGQSIDAIVLHYTTSRNVHGSISWFQNPASKVSAHYIVDRDGKIYQLVKDSDKAWHCYGFNTTSIGIEHVAAPGDRLTTEQEQASAALIRWLISEYEISLDRIYGHRWNPEEPGGTSCPGSLWKNSQELKTWLQQKVFDGTHSPSEPIARTRAVSTPITIGSQNRRSVDLPVPYFKQLDNKYNPSGACNVTSVAMCLRYFGIVGDASEKQLEDQMYQRCIRNGWSRHTPEGLKKLIESYPGCKDDLTRTGSLADIRKALDEGKPCIVHGYFTDFGHILVIRGYNDVDFLINDPFGEWFPNGYRTELTGEKRKYSKRAIAACCHAYSRGEALDLYARMSDHQMESFKEIWLHRVYRVN